MVAVDAAVAVSGPEAKGKFNVSVVRLVHFQTQSILICFYCFLIGIFGKNMSWLVDKKSKLQLPLSFCSKNSYTNFHMHSFSCFPCRRIPVCVIVCLSKCVRSYLPGLYSAIAPSSMRCYSFQVECAILSLEHFDPPPWRVIVFSGVLVTRRRPTS